jgi:hypothetical protein
MKKRLMAVFLLVSPLFAQGQVKDQVEIALNAAGCGPSQVMFDVTTDKNQHPLTQPEAGKALVYVINYVFRTVKVGVDGSWLGANNSFSYFSFSVDPGEHHLCMSVQGDHKQGSAGSFTATAGQSHYFRLSLEETGWKLKTLDPALGQFLIASSALSTSRPRK